MHNALACHTVRGLEVQDLGFRVQCLGSVGLQEATCRLDQSQL